MGNFLMFLPHEINKFVFLLELMFKLLDLVLIGNFIILNLISIVLDLLSELEVFIFLDIELLI